MGTDRDKAYGSITNEFEDYPDFEVNGKSPVHFELSCEFVGFELGLKRIFEEDV